jgi:hypothetical protein
MATAEGNRLIMEFDGWELKKPSRTNHSILKPTKNK